MAGETERVDLTTAEREALRAAMYAKRVKFKDIARVLGQTPQAVKSPDDEDVAFAAGAFEIAHVTHVQSIEAAVRQDDSGATALAVGENLAEMLARNNLGIGF